jgi:hypothetical protein
VTNTDAFVWLLFVACSSSQGEKPRVADEQRTVAPNATPGTELGDLTLLARTCDPSARTAAEIRDREGLDSAPVTNAGCRVPLEMEPCVSASYRAAHADDCAGFRAQFEQAPAILVTKTEIRFAGQVVVPLHRVPRDGKPVGPLLELLDASAKQIERELPGRASKDVIKACDDAKQGIRARGAVCPLGLLIVRSDASTGIEVINTIVVTARAAGFDQLVFAVAK